MWHIAEYQILIAGKKPDKKRDEEAEMYPWSDIWQAICAF